MQYQFPSDIEAQIQAQMATGNYRSHDDLFRVALEHLADQDRELRAIEESLDLLGAGDPGIPLADAFASVRAKYDVPADA
jgi:Arc/MetJ-type ribon-helix-helix transcriptional regulator